MLAALESSQLPESLTYLQQSCWEHLSPSGVVFFSAEGAKEMPPASDAARMSVFIADAVAGSPLHLLLSGRSLHRGSGEVPEQVSQQSCGCSVPGGVQDQVGWDPGQPGLVPDLEIGGPAVAGGLEFGVSSNPSHSVIL